MSRTSYKTVERVVPSIDEYLTEANIQKDLKTACVGRKIYAFGVLKTTNDYAFKLAEDGAPEGSVVIAEEQTAGKGRLGRTWYSPPGVGIWCSIILRPPLFPWEAPRMTMVAALAAARCIHSVIGLRATLKWPNDVLIENRKVCGILTELCAEIDLVNFVIIGIGLNVNQQREEFPEDIQEKATSLRIECGTKISRIAVLHSLFMEFESIYGQMMEAGFSSLRREIQSLSCVIQRVVSVRLKNRTYQGKVLDIDNQGHLVVELTNGQVEHIEAGDISLVEE